jgi:predicted phage tail protein
MKNETRKIRRVYLYGAMAEKFGSDPIELALDNIPSLLLALRSIHKDWRAHISKNPEVCFVVSGDNKENARALESEMLGVNLGNETEIHILPATDGEITMAMVAAWGITNVYVAALIVVLSNFAISAALGAISQALAPSPETGAGSRNQVAENKSFLFNGPVNVQEQGGPVQVVYGYFLVGSTVVSSGIDVEQLLTTPAQSIPPANGGGTVQPTSPPAVSWQWTGQ